MNNSSLVSVIMNCYNGEKFLEEAVTSVINQTYENWELIFWDNQSEDDSAAIIKSYNDCRIRYFYAVNHTNLGNARNLAMSEALGEWIAFLDVDDVWLPQKLEKNIEAIRNSDCELDLIYSRCEFFSTTANSDSDFVTVGTHPKIRELPTTRLYDLLFYGNFIPFPSTMYRKRSIEQLGGIPDYRFSPDFFLAMGLAREGRVFAIDQTLCRYRLSDGSMSNQFKLLGWQEGAEIIKNFSILDGDERKSRPFVSAYIVMCIFNRSYAGLLEERKNITPYGFFAGLFEYIFVRYIFMRLKI